MGRRMKQGPKSPEGEEGESKQQAKDKGRLLNVASHQGRISMHTLLYCSVIQVSRDT